MQRGTADSADFVRFGAGYRRQDCQCVLEITKDTKDTKDLADWLIRRLWGAAPRPGRGRGASAPQRTENRKQKTERAASARQNNRCAEKPNCFQTSNCPCTPGTSATCPNWTTAASPVALRANRQLTALSVSRLVAFQGTNPSPHRGVLFSVLCSPFSGAAQPPLCGKTFLGSIDKKPRRGRGF